MPVFTVQLGDIIDGHKDDNHNNTQTDLDSVVRVISQFKYAPAPCYWKSRYVGR